MTTLRISQLLLDLYSCPTERARWPVVLDQICRTLRVRSAVVQMLLAEGGRLRSRWMVRDSQSEAARSLHDRYFSDAVNPRMLAQRSGTQPLEGIFRDSDFFAPGDPLLSHLQQGLAATGLGHFMSARVRMTTGEALTLVLHRDAHDEQDFSKREERLALELMPHLRQAVQLSGTMHDAQTHIRCLQQSMDGFRLGLLICNSDGVVAWSNEAADHLLACREVLWLNAGRQLVTHSSHETAALRQNIAQAARETPDAPNVSSESGAHLLVVGAHRPNALQVRCHGLTQGLTQRLVQGTAGQELARREQVLVMLWNPNSNHSLPPELLKQLFGLSPAESRLAAALCAGSTLNEYAAQAGVAIGTARYQLKQVMAKTQVSKQSQLVQRLCTSVVFHLRN